MSSGRSLGAVTWKAVSIYNFRLYLGTFRKLLVDDLRFLINERW